MNPNPVTIATSARAVRVYFDEDSLYCDLEDGRTITVPLAWYPRLFRATPAQREHCVISPGGYGIHWPDLDEDLSVKGFLAGAQ